MKQNKAKNHHISNTINHNKISKKQLKIFFTGSNYTVIKSNHLYEERSGNKQRDKFIDDNRYQEIILLALQNGLNSFREQGPVVITIANSEKKNHSCTSLLIALDSKNNITIITAIQSYGDRKWSIGFSKIQNRINIVPSVYILPRLSIQELDSKNKEKIFNQKSEEQYKEDKLFNDYIKYNKLSKVN